MENVSGKLNFETRKHTPASAGFIQLFDKGIVSQESALCQKTTVVSERHDR
jgi:hypothetical protein